MKYKDVPFKNLLEVIIDNRGKTCPTEDFGIPLIATNCIKNETLYPVFEKVRYISQNTYENWFRGHPEPNDIIFVLKGSPGRVSWVSSPVNFCIAQDMVAIRANKNIIDSKYLFALLRSQTVQTQIENMHVGTLIPHFKKGDFDKLILRIIDDLNIQKKIGEIYFLLSDKIELNRKMNQTLESIASAIFKSWFVDFDPVHAKANCEEEAEVENIARELGISKAILDLFPSEFIESELGMIPKGWKNDYLDTFVEILDSKRVPLASNEREKIKGDIPYYGATSIMGYVNDYIFEEILLLMGEDGSVVRDDGTPFLQYIWGKSWVNNHAHVMKSKSTLSVEALYIALINKNVTMFVTGAVQPKINQGNLKQIPIINAGEIINKTFSSLIEPIFAKIRLISEENTSLQKTRDTLLPKLLSGEIDVSELEL